MQDTNDSEISKFYDGKNIFITGATGFMGKVLVEKLLRDCSGLNRVYILIRNKRGMNSEARCIDFINHLVFDNLRKTNPDALKKVKAVSGDVSCENLGLHEDDAEMLIENVNIVFHCAANVRFDQSLREAVNFNTVGTLRVLKLAEQMKNLQVFLHVSTTYCHCKETVLEERYYPATENPFGIIEMVNVLKDETLKAMTPKLLEGLPNTYAFTKGLTEDIVHDYMSKFPIAIIRPSIVTAAWKAPIEGWVEGLNGPTGLTLVAAKGVLRSMYCNPNYRSQTIPVDIVINVIIAVAYQRSQMPNGSEFYCNVADFTEKPITWGESIEISKKILAKYPLTQMLWYPDGSIKSNYYHHLICSVLFHYLPAYFIDFLMILCQQKPFLVNIQKRISLGLKVLQYYTTRDWVFKCDNCIKVHQDMSPVDKQKFYCNLEELDMNVYLEKYLVGIRHYIAKDTPESLPQARKTFKILYFADRTIKFLFVALIIYFMLRSFMKVN